MFVSSAAGRMLAIAMVALLPGCSEQAPPGIASNGCGLGAEATAPAQLGVASFTFVGAEESEAEGLFGAISDVVVAGSGTMFVADPMAKHVVRMPGGSPPVGTIGGPGSGPGEFEAPTVMASVGDTLSVFDARLWRVSLFGPDGELIEVHRLEPDPGLGQVTEVQIDGRGSIYRLSYRGFEQAVRDALGARNAGLVRGTNRIERWEPTTNEWTELLEVPGREVYADLSSGALRDPPFPQQPVWAASAEEGFWYADSSERLVGRYGPDGQLLCSVALDILPTIAVSDEDRTSFYDASGYPPSMAPRIRQSRRDMPMPETKPLLSGIIEAPDGGPLWVRSGIPTMGARETWYRLDGEGAARVALPDRFSLMDAGGDRLIGLYRDTLNVPYVGVVDLAGPVG